MTTLNDNSYIIDSFYQSTITATGCTGPQNLVVVAGATAGTWFMTTRDTPYGSVTGPTGPVGATGPAGGPTGATGATGSGMTSALPTRLGSVYAYTTDVTNATGPTGPNNSVFLGYNAGLNMNPNNAGNILIGTQCGTGITGADGGYNAIVGYYAGRQLDGVGNSFLNAALGTQAINSGRSVRNTVAVGPYSGDCLANGAAQTIDFNNCIYLGGYTNSGATAGSSSISHEYVLGQVIDGSGSNSYTMRIASIPVSTQTALHINTSTGKLSRPSSSERYKIDQHVPSLLDHPEAILSLQPRAYLFKDDCNDPRCEPRLNVGYYAEEVESILQDETGKSVFDPLLHYEMEDDPDQVLYCRKTTCPETQRPLEVPVCKKRRTRVDGIDYTMLIVPLIELVKKMNGQIMTLQDQVDNLLLQASHI